MIELECRNEATKQWTERIRCDDVSALSFSSALPPPAFLTLQFLLECINYCCRAFARASPLPPPLSCTSQSDEALSFRFGVESFLYCACKMDTDATFQRWRSVITLECTPALPRVPANRAKVASATLHCDLTPSTSLSSHRWASPRPASASFSPAELPRAHVR